MKVSLVAETQPFVPGVKTAEELIVYVARVSNPNNQLNFDTSERLLNYCMKHGHWSVFETVNLTLEIQTSRAISAQIIRHRSFCFQEFSQRYSTVTNIEPFELRKQGATNRQVGDEVINDPEINELVEKNIAETQALYNELLQRGVAKESARMILPMASQTTLYMTGNIRSWIHYIRVRHDSGKKTQKEHWEIAGEVEKIFAERYPIIYAAALNYIKEPSTK